MDTLRSQLGLKDSPDDYEDEKFSGVVNLTPSISPLKPYHSLSTEPQLQQTPNSNPNFTTPINNNNNDEDEEDEEVELMEVPSSATTTTTTSAKKQKPLSAFTGDQPPPPAKKPKKKTNNNVWTKSTSRKGKKKSRSAPHHPPPLTPQDTVLITPVARFPDKSDDSPSFTILLSRFHKAEKIDLSDDRLTASSTKGYRMVRANRGVADGAWYFEIRILRLGATGHTRLGWATEKGDLQAPVGYDGSSYAFRDVDGSKVHKALRERYAAEGYGEGDVIGFYIYLPEGSSYAPKPPHLVWYKGQRYMYSADGKDEAPKVVPGSEISFFKNGVCQGTAFTDIVGGRYYPAASMYTLPDQPNCEVRFNFGPNFESLPQSFGGRPAPRPMVEVPYHGYDVKVEGPTENGFGEKTNS